MDGEERETSFVDLSSDALAGGGVPSCYFTGRVLVRANKKNDIPEKGYCGFWGIANVKMFLEL